MFRHKKIGQLVCMDCYDAQKDYWLAIKNQGMKEQREEKQKMARIKKKKKMDKKRSTWKNKLKCKKKEAGM